jgi:hypothetical protein
LTIIDFDVDFADVVLCAFWTARRGRPAASSTTCASSCQFRPHSCMKWVCYKVCILDDFKVRHSRRPNSCCIAHAHVQQSIMSDNHTTTK